MNEIQLFRHGIGQGGRYQDDAGEKNLVLTKSHEQLPDETLRLQIVDMEGGQMADGRIDDIDGFPAVEARQHPLKIPARRRTGQQRDQSLQMTT
ncbi:hypothetical protein [Acidithiobacillus caldus]|uniref:hypothetical protein n=1 Tax=Acidithiobacillus caldus TaxID=33059 RepID=UPI001F1CD52F|nr:hypothetical protein [Acidithiobacillus caldus]